MPKNRLIPRLEACLVTFLWSSSYILVKIGLTQISPLTLSALRYIIASSILLPIALLRGGAKHLRDARTIMRFALLGLSGYTIAQGLQCVGLFYLPAVSVTLILNFTPVIVLIMGVVFLRECPTLTQLVGMGVTLLGACLFFNAPLSASSLTGVLVTLFSGFGWATYMVTSRFLFVRQRINPLHLTAMAMTLGTLVIATGAYLFEGLPNVSLPSMAIILWLGVVNTALAFFLWNHALQKLEALEISVLQNTMLIQIALLSWLFLGEQLTDVKILSIVLVFIGVLTVQLRR